MKKMIFCFMFLLVLGGCRITSTPLIVYDCAEADKKALADFVINCAGNQIPVFEATGEFNRRLDNCTEKAKEMFCRPIAPKPDNPTSTP